MYSFIKGTIGYAARLSSFLLAHPLFKITKVFEVYLTIEEIDLDMNVKSLNYLQDFQVYN